MRIQAKQQFSHFHHGTFEGGEQRNVPDDVGEALVGMGLATDVTPVDGAAPTGEDTTAAAKPKPRGRGAQSGGQ